MCDVWSELDLVSFDPFQERFLITGLGVLFLIVSGLLALLAQEFTSAFNAPTWC